MTASNYQTQIDSTLQPFVQSIINDDIAYKFFVYFARFEYAMKRSRRYLEGNENCAAKANWKKLGEDWDKSFVPARTQEFQASVNYLKNNPPKKQVVINKELNWVPISKGDPEKHGTYLLEIVRVVRNNLFHGGKFPLPVGKIAESSRDKELLHHCLIVLAECLQCMSTLQQYLLLDV